MAETPRAHPGWTLSIALLAAALLVLPAQAATYSEYANATLENQISTLRIQKNLYKLLTYPDTLKANAAAMGHVKSNQSWTQNYTTELYTVITEAIKNSNSGQANLSEGLATLGANASQLTCGNASGGNCQTQAGVQGRSRVAKEQAVYVKQGGKGLELGGLRVDIFRLSTSWWVEWQKAFVGSMWANGNYSASVIRM